MSSLLVWKERLQNLYAKYAMFIDKGLQFVLAFLTFHFINTNIGSVKLLEELLSELVLAAICAFLPPVFTVLISAALVLAHIAASSIAIFSVVAVFYLLMFIFYFRFAPKTATVLLLVPICFLFKIPYVIPIACGLLGMPILAVPSALGTITYFIIHQLHISSAVILGADGMIGQIMMFSNKVLQNKEMWMMTAVFVLCILVVSAVKSRGFEHAWKIAIAVGTILNLAIVMGGCITFDIPISFVQVILGTIISAILCLVLELFVFSIDYARTETLEYEDDEYYYYVKAVPKVSLSAPKKTVKKINYRKETEKSNEIPKREPKKQEAAKKESYSSGLSEDEILLAKQLQDDAEIEAFLKEEFDRGFSKNK